MPRNFRLQAAFVSCLLIVTAAASGVALFAPARAAAAMQQLLAYACSDKQPCLSVVSSSSAKAILASAQASSAIEGRKFINNNKRPLAALNSYEGALTGLDLSTNMLDNNAGVVGRSDYGTGVAGITSFDSSTNGFFQMGTLGLDVSRTINGNSGVRGQSVDNIGVVGHANGTTMPGCTFLCTKSGIGVSVRLTKAWASRDTGP